MIPMIQWIGGDGLEGAKADEEGSDLVGQPTFTELPNGRFRCVETGHEMVAGDVEPYSRSKRCRLGLIDFALHHNKPPLNMFKQDPLCRSKLICKLTEDRLNKSEQHIWKHINGRRFLNKLVQKEVEEAPSKQLGVMNKKKKQEMKMRKSVDEIRSEVRDPSAKDGNLHKDSRDHDIGSSAESEQDTDELSGTDIPLGEDYCEELENISIRTKRMSIAIGPSSFASRKKKPKT
ncbi:hypothetical protein SAY86_006375 [Trapa natans]|uniref:Surfeit locus protein 2 n=1 Tax=Trapa natans TaxID=22666 RepID=A0AAN7QU79_TRANT|nr:hypothetical protein SAY86_006375 [Trapa natans]